MTFLPNAQLYSDTLLGEADSCTLKCGGPQKNRRLNKEPA